MDKLKLTLLLFCFIAFSAIPIFADNDYDFLADGIYYNINGDNVSVTLGPLDNYYSGSYTGDISIPETVNYNGRTYTVNKIESEAFVHSSITSINLPKSITVVGNYAFEYCSKLRKITCLATTPPTSYNHSFYTYNATLYVPVESLSAYKNTLYWSYFYYFEPIHDFEQNGIYYNVLDQTNKTVEVTYRDTYYNSYSGIVTIPSSVNYDGNVYTVTSIGNSAFRNSKNLTDVCLPKSINYIGEYAFYGCTGLINFTCFATTPPTVQDNSFNSYSNNATLRVLKLYLGAYNSYNWSSFKSREPIYVYDFEQDGLCYNIISQADKTVEVTYRDTTYNSYNGAINIPSKVVYTGTENDTYTGTSFDVNHIGNHAFDNCISLSSVNIPNSILTIDNRAFYNCKYLTTISIPSSVTSIGSAAFQGCNSLSILNYNSVVCEDFSSWSSNPFYNLNISTINVGDVVQRIPAYFAYGMSNLSNLSIGNSVTSIGDYAFYNCTELNNFTLPNSLKTIGNYSFQGCTSITTVTIPNLVTSIGYSAFQGCSSLTTLNYNAVSCSGFSSSTYHPFYSLNISTINVGDAVQKIPSYFAYNFTKLTNLSIGNSLTSICDYSFYNCSSLSSLTLPFSLTSIGNSSFSNCTSLASITIPKNVSFIGSSAFKSCSSLYELNFNAINCDDFSSESPFRYSYIGTINVGNNVEKIPAYLASGLTTLRNLNIGNSVKTIGTYAFQGCNSLTEVIFGNSVETIDNLSFFQCTGLKKITLPNTVTTIGTSAFYGCSGLTEVILPASIKTLGFRAFYYCNGIQSVYSYAEDPPIMGSDDCFTVYNTATLYVPNLYLDTYKNTLYWSRFLKIYGLDENDNVLASDIALNFTEKALNVNQTLQLIATVTPEIASNKTVTWSSSDPIIANVNNDGLVTAFADGNATITATTTDGTNLSASCNLTVTSIPVASIKLNKTRLTLDIDESYQLVATITPTNATDKTIVWSSSDTTIATVSDNGLVIPNEPGDAVITASTTDGTNLSASCQVTVVKRVKEITLNESSLHLTLPETAQLTAFVSPNDATNAVLNWTSSKPSVATVDNNGFIISKSVGTTTIKATTTDGSNLSATCQVNVTKQYVNSILLNEDSLIMHIGETFQLIADVQPENASNPNLNWISNNSSVASVDNTGLITANSGGTTLILVSATDGTNITSSCFIEVVPDYYIEIDTLTHIRGSSTQIVDLPVSLINKNPISGIQFDVTLPDNVQFNTIDDIPDIWLDDARGTRSHSISASKLNDGKYRILVTSSTSKNLKGNDGELVHMNLVLPQVHDSGDCLIIFSNIIASEANETRHNLDNKSTSVHFYYIVGDADANAIVDIADHASTASKILGKSPSPFYFEAANVDANGSLDVVDLVGITNIALGIKPITVRQAPLKGVVENHLFCEKLNLNAGGDRELTIGIDCGFDFAGFQMDLKLPNGLNLTGAMLGENTAILGIASETMHDGTIRFLGTSFSDAEVDGCCRELITLKVKADNNYIPGSEIEFLNILFAERYLTAHSFDSSNVEFIEPSSIYELVEDARIYIEDGNIIVDTPFEGSVRLISVDGRMVEYRAHIGHNVYKTNANGIYIIHFNGKTIKVRL